MPRQALHPEGPTPTSCFRDPQQKLRQHPGAWRRQQGLPSPPAGLAAPYVVGSAEPPPPRPHHLPTRAARDPVHTLPRTSEAELTTGKPKREEKMESKPLSANTFEIPRRYCPGLLLADAGHVEVPAVTDMCATAPPLPLRPGSSARGGSRPLPTRAAPGSCRPGVSRAPGGRLSRTVQFNRTEFLSEREPLPGGVTR